MATICGLFFKAGGAETGGANSETGLRTGTLISIGGSTPLNFPALNTVYTAYYRAIDSATGLDTGEDSTSVIVPTLPTGYVGCFTFGGTYSATPTTGAAVVKGGNQPLFLKQTALTDSADVDITIGALDWQAGTRVGQVGTVTPTPGDAKVTLAWSAVPGAASYDLYHSATNTAPALGAVPTVAGVASGVEVTGLANGAPRYFWVRANAATGAGAWSAGVTATPVAGATTVFYNNFEAGESLNSTYLDTNVANSGSVTVASNKLTINTVGNDSKGALLRFKDKINKSTRKRYTVKFEYASGTPWFLMGIASATIPACATGIPDGETFAIARSSSLANALMQYYDSNSTSRQWRITDNTYNASQVIDAWPALAANTVYYAILEHDSSGFVLELRDASYALITRTTKIAWSASYSRGKTGANQADIWLTMGDLYTQYWQVAMTVYSIKVETLPADIT